MNIDHRCYILSRGSYDKQSIIFLKKKSTGKKKKLALEFTL